MLILLFFKKVQILSNEGEITSSELLSLWSEVFVLFLFFLMKPNFFYLFFLCSQNEKDFGELELLAITPDNSNQLTQIRCTCDQSCSGIFSFPLLSLFSSLPSLLPSAALLSCFSLIIIIVLLLLEPLFVRAELEIDNKEVIIYFIYQPSGVLAPIEGKCETFVEAYGYNFFFLIPLSTASFHICVHSCLFINA